MRRARRVLALVTTGALVVPGSQALASSADCVGLSAKTKTGPGAQQVALTAAINLPTNDPEISFRVRRVIVIAPPAGGTPVFLNPDPIGFTRPDGPVVWPGDLVPCP